MGYLVKRRGHELLSWDYSNVAADAEGTVMLRSKNLNPDPLFEMTNNSGKMRYWRLRHAPRPDGWGVLVKKPGQDSVYSEQNGYPMPLGDQPYFDLAQPVISGATQPDKDEQIDIAQPEAPRAVIFLTADKAFTTGWYCLAHGYRMKDPERLTTPDPATAGQPSSRTEPFQMGPTTGRAFFLPQPPKDAVDIVIYLTNGFALSSDALNARMFEQFVIPIDNNRSNTIELRGPLKLDKQAPRENRTKLSHWGGPGAFNIEKMNRGDANQHYYAQFAYELVDYTGHSIAAISDKKEMNENSKKQFKFKPIIDTLWKVARRSVQGYRPYVRYQTHNNGNWNWSGWKKIKKTHGDDVFPLDTFVEVQGPEWNHNYGFEVTKGSPASKDTTGISNPTEPMTMLDSPLALDSAGLQNGDYRFKTILYAGDLPSEPSPPTKVNIGATNQVPRIYQPFKTNRLDNPDLIDTNSSVNRPRDWTFHRDARTTYEKGKVRVDETDGQITRGDILTTPYGYIDRSELNFGARVIVETAKHVGGKAVDVMLEYEITGKDSNNKPVVNFLKQSTLGVHRRNGQYAVGYKLRRQTQARNAIKLENNTDLVIIRTIGDGTDANLGARNYEVFRKGHGIFQQASPRKRKSVPLADKIDWFEFDDDTYPHGGYCRVVQTGEDVRQTSVVMNGTDTGINITTPVGNLVTDVATSEKTIEVRFKTGEDIQTQQYVYRQGNATQGYAFIINGGNLIMKSWTASGATQNSVSFGPLYKHAKYLATFVRTSTGAVAYMDGIQVGTSSAAQGSFASQGSASAGYNSGNARNAGNTSETTTRNMTGKIYEVRIWNVSRSASQVSDAAFRNLAVENEDLALYLKIHELEGAQTYDVAGNDPAITGVGNFVGDFRWANDVPDAAYIHGAGVITNGRVNFNDNQLSVPGWTKAGTATDTHGDFSVSRFSDYGLRLTGSTTNLRYITRATTGLTSKAALGAQKKFVTIPTGGDMILLQARDATGPVFEVQITNTKLLQMRAYNGVTPGTWTTMERGVEAGERLYFEAKAEGLGTATGVLRGFVGTSEEDELTQTALLTGLTFTGRSVTEVRAGAVAISNGTISNTWDYHMGVVTVSTDGRNRKDYIPGNYIEYYGPPDTPPDEEYGPTGLEIPLTPGKTVTHSVYAMAEELQPSFGRSALIGSIYDEDGRLIESLPPLVQFFDNESDWQRHSNTFIVPDNGAYLRYEANNIGSGMYRILGLQVENSASATAYTALRQLSGYVEVLFDSIIPGCEPGKPMDNLGKTVGLSKKMFNGEDPPGTTITTQIASSATKTGTYTAFFNDIDNVPRNRWYKVRVTMTTADRQITPVLTAVFVRVIRPEPALLKPGGAEYKGGTILNNVGPPVDRRLVEVTQQEDGSQGFVTWGSETPIQWIETAEVTCFRPSVVAEISGNVGKGDSTFIYEYNGMLYTVRVVEPITWEYNRANKIPLPTEDEDFYVFKGTIPAGEVIDVQEI